MKKSISIIVILVLSILGACSNNESSDSNVLKVATSLGEGDPIYDGLIEFSGEVEKQTDGRISVEIYGNDSLGELNDIIEQAKEGANVAALVDTGRLSDYIPEIGILTGPYIVEDYEEANLVTKSALFEEWREELVEKEELNILAFNWYQGDRHFVTKSPINVPSDLKGMKIRTIDSSIASKTMESLGASPTGEPFSEVYSAIQQGVIDGLEVQYPALWDQKLYEVNAYVAKTGHFQLLTGLIAGEKWLNNISEEDKNIIFDAAFEYGEKASNEAINSLDKYEEDLKSEGLEIIEVNKEDFKETTSKVYDEIEGYLELKKDIESIIND